MEHHRQRRREPHLLRVQAVIEQDRLQLGDRADYATIMEVVSNPGAHVLQPIDREQETALGVAFDERVQRIVLENHRQAFAAIDIAAKPLVRHDRLTQCHGERRLDGEVDLQVRRTEARDRLPEALVQSRSQWFRHPFAAHDGRNIVRRPIEVGRIDHRLEKRWIAGDHVLVLRTEQLERGQCLAGIWSDGLDDASVDQRHRHVHPRCPRPQREAVEQDESLVTECGARGILDQAPRRRALRRPAHPVCRRPARAGRLVDYRVPHRQAAALAQHLNWPLGDVVVLVHGRDLLQATRVGGAVPREKFLIRWHRPTRVVEGSRCATAADPSARCTDQAGREEQPVAEPRCIRHITDLARREAKGPVEERIHSRMDSSRGALGGRSLYPARITSQQSVTPKRCAILAA